MSLVQKQVTPDWYEFLKPIIYTNKFKENWQKIVKDYKSMKCYPEVGDIFKAFKVVDLEDLTVIIIGQDPYHDGSATGLAFDTDGKKITPSLDQIYKGFCQEYPHNFYTDLMDGKLHRWSEHGIMLLNTVLTVQKGKPNSHLEYWEDFTEALFKKINEINRPILYVAWGKNAQIVTDNLITNPKHKVVKASHPVSASYQNKMWDSKGSFQAIEKFIQENYNKKFEWEPIKKLR